MKLHYDHPLATGRVTNDNIAQQSYLLSQVEERQIVLHGIVPDRIADIVMKRVHQMALPYWQYLVKSTTYVEAYSRSKRYSILHLLAREPLLVAASEVQLVAVMPGLPAAYNRLAFGQADMTDARQGIHYLLLFPAHLLVIRQALPLASATYTKVFAERFLAQGTGLYDTLYLAFHETVFLAGYAHVHDISRHGVGNK